MLLLWYCSFEWHEDEVCSSFFVCLCLPKSTELHQNVEVKWAISHVASCDLVWPTLWSVINIMNNSAIMFLKHDTNIITILIEKLDNADSTLLHMLNSEPAMCLYNVYMPTWHDSMKRWIYHASSNHTIYVVFENTYTLWTIKKVAVHLWP